MQFFLRILFFYSIFYLLYSVSIEAVKQSFLIKNFSLFLINKKLFLILKPCTLDISVLPTTIYSYAQNMPQWVIDILCDGMMIRTGMDNEGMFFNL